MTNIVEEQLYTHRDTSITTVDGFVGSLSSIVRGWTVVGLLSYPNSPTEEKSRNIDLLFEEWNLETRKKYQREIEFYRNATPETKDNSSLQPLPLEVFQTLRIPVNKFNREVVITESNQEVKERSFSQFNINKLVELQKDPKYKRVDTGVLSKLGLTRDIFPKNTVWIWSRVLGQFFNLTPFIGNLTTHVDSNGGNWSISLPPVIGEYVEEKVKDSRYSQSVKNWKIREGSISFSKNGEYISHGNLHTKRDGIRNKFFFKNIISENDLIFIRFETLENEISNRIKYIRDLEIPSYEIPGKIYDMIGLVDSIKESQSAGDISIQVAGRDFIKPLIEDGCYFYATEFVPGGIFIDNSKNELERKRGIDRIDGKIYSLAQTAIKSIDFSLKFIINALSNINIVPDDLL